jgi:hypothetical protein
MGDDWIPYVVRTGDYLLKVATRLGFDADQVWSDARNGRLRSVRGSPNVLCSGDVLYVPEKAKRWLRVKTGAVNRFTVHVPLLVRDVIGGPRVDRSPTRRKDAAPLGTIHE